MGRGTRAPLPAEVDEVRAKVERWRQQRKGLGPMPDQLWAEAAELASRFGISPVCQAMGLSYAALKTRMNPSAGRGQLPVPPPKSQAPVFMELGGESLLSEIQAGPVLEVTSPEGMRLVLRLPVGITVDLASLMTSFLGCRG